MNIINGIIAATIAFTGGTSLYVYSKKHIPNENTVSPQQVYSSNNRASSYYGSMMGNAMGTMMGGYSQNIDTLSSDDIKKQMELTLKNAVINKQENTITYTGDNVTIALLGGPEQADGRFVIGDLVNPTIHVPKNAHVSLELINADEGMPHGIEITSAKPPYIQMPMMQGGTLGASIIPPLPSAQNDQYPVSQTASFQLNQSGQFYYICQYPGHAADGMYGKIIFD